VTRIRSGALAACLVAVLFATGCGGGGSLGAQSLAKQSDAIVSLAAEGALLAHDGADGRTTAIFTREHAADLSKAAATTASSLGKATTKASLEPRLRELRRLAAQVRVQLRRLDGASADDERAIAHGLERAAAAAKKIGDGLS
jgi:hypothetical protein